MKISIYKILDIISTSAGFLFAFSVFFIVQYWTIGLLPLFKDIILLNTIYLKDFAFTLSSLIITFKFIKIDNPYRKYLSKH